MKRNISPFIRKYYSHERMIATKNTSSILPSHYSTTFTSSSLHTTSITSNKANTISTEDQKRLDIAIVGAPNAGKSQLLNCIIQSNVAAVSRKRHTTRNEIMGIRTINDTQLVFVDTPGYLRLQSAKQEQLLRDLIVTATSEMDQADYTLLVVDAARNLDEGLKEALVGLILRALSATRTGLFGVVLNKVDLVKPKKELLNVAAVIGDLVIRCIKYNEEQKQQDYNNVAHNGGIITDNKNTSIANHKELVEQSNSTMEDDNKSNIAVDMETYNLYYPEIFYTSALQNDGVDDIIQYLLKIAPYEEWIYEAHETSQLSPVERVEEIIREKIYRSVHREIPHNVTQVNRVFEVFKRRIPNDTMKDGIERMIRIDQDLVVKTESHRRILKGRDGKTLARIQYQASKDLERLFQCRVSLHLHVKKSTSQYDRNLDPESSAYEFPES